MLKTLGTIAAVAVASPSRSRRRRRTRETDGSREAHGQGSRHVQRQVRDHEGSDRHRGPPRVVSSRRRPFLQPRQERLLRRREVLPGRSRTSSCSGAFTAIPSIATKWLKATIADDPVKESNKRGFVTLRQERRPTAVRSSCSSTWPTTSRLDSMGFAPFGQVTEGMDVVDKLYDGYGGRAEASCRPHRAKRGTRSSRRSTRISTPSRRPPSNDDPVAAGASRLVVGIAALRRRRSAPSVHGRLVRRSRHVHRERSRSSCSRNRRLRPSPTSRRSPKDAWNSSDAVHRGARRRPRSTTGLAVHKTSVRADGSRPAIRPARATACRSSGSPRARAWSTSPARTGSGMTAASTEADQRVMFFRLGRGRALPEWPATTVSARDRRKGATSSIASARSRRPTTGELRSSASSSGTSRS